MNAVMNIDNCKKARHEEGGALTKLSVVLTLKSDRNTTSKRTVLDVGHIVHPQRARTPVLQGIASEIVTQPMCVVVVLVRRGEITLGDMFMYM